MTVRFDEAWARARAVAATVCEAGIDVVLVRDILGRVSLVLDNDRHLTISITDLADRLRVEVGPFAAPQPVREAADLVEPKSTVESADLVVERERDTHHGRLSTLERRVVGADWTRPLERRPSCHRVTLYGFKGGVGRSTATFMLGQHLAQRGNCVLIVDLDLESPGIGALTQHDDDLSGHGIVDHLVEDAVGNAHGLELVSRSRLAHTGRNGEMWLAPAAGRPRQGYDYLAKLNRIYTDLPPAPDGRRRNFGDRLHAAVRACESQVTELSRMPDVVLLDTRAGVHDVAAVALTQLGDINLLFGADNAPTWRGYQALFAQWQTTNQRRAIGERLKMVSSMTPDTDTDGYLAAFRDRAQECFAGTLYEDAAPNDLDAFNFGVDDLDAPHSPLAILFHRDLVGLDPVRQPEWHAQPLIRAAFETFLEQATTLITEDPQ